MSVALNLLNFIDTIYESELDEAVPKRAISFAGGKRHTKLQCPHGSKLKGGTCVRESMQELRNRKKGAKLAVRKRRAHKAQSNRKRAMTMRRRRMSVHTTVGLCFDSLR